MGGNIIRITQTILSSKCSLFKRSMSIQSQKTVNKINIPKKISIPKIPHINQKEENRKSSGIIMLIYRG